MESLCRDGGDTPIRLNECNGYEHITCPAFLFAIRLSNLVK